jgi:cytochrome c5
VKIHSSLIPELNRPRSRGDRRPCLSLLGLRGRVRLSYLVAPWIIAWSVGAAEPTPAPPPHPLVWDAMELSVVAKPGEKEAKFQFHVTNMSAQPVEIIEIRASCGCTVAEMPSTPWILAAGAKGSFSAVVDFQGKAGRLLKTLHVDSAAGGQMLTMMIDIPETEESRRARNQQMAFMDRQAVFRGACASCHVAPTVGKTGAELFQAACGICHQASHRASMVPDLTIVREPRDAEFWRRWIAEGKDRTLMPAFARERGGPLTAEQIASLVEYAMREFPTAPRAN